MTYPRSHLVDPEGGVYHVCSRCVRRAFLCGTDKLTGFNFDHRQAWIERRILWLATIFSIDVYGYAVMSNHYHIVLKVNATDANEYSEELLVDKWLMLNPRKNDSSTTLQARKFAYLEDKDGLNQLRARLGSLSWFMRYLNEPLARLANKEDACKGRFWESRFKSQRLLDETAILACMVYVDLNPIRAGITNDLKLTKHTSLANRRKRPAKPNSSMMIISSIPATLPFSMSFEEYSRLCLWTLKVQLNKSPDNFNGLPPPDIWYRQYMPKPGCWQRAIGSAQSMKDYANSVGQRWIRTVAA
jgi:hypothetical protein